MGQQAGKLQARDSWQWSQIDLNALYSSKCSGDQVWKDSLFCALGTPNVSDATSPSTAMLLAQSQLSEIPASLRGKIADVLDVVIDRLSFAIDVGPQMINDQILSYVQTILKDTLGYTTLELQVLLRQLKTKIGRGQFQWSDLDEFVPLIIKLNNACVYGLNLGELPMILRPFRSKVQEYLDSILGLSSDVQACKSCGSQCASCFTLCSKIALDELLKELIGLTGWRTANRNLNMTDFSVVDPISGGHVRTSEFVNRYGIIPFSPELAGGEIESESESDSESDEEEKAEPLDVLLDELKQGQSITCAALAEKMIQPTLAEWAQSCRLGSIEFLNVVGFLRRDSDMQEFSSQWKRTGAPDDSSGNFETYMRLLGVKGDVPREQLKTVKDIPAYDPEYLCKTIEAELPTMCHLDRYKVIKVLGQGQYGLVLLMESKTDPQDRIAVKLGQIPEGQEAQARDMLTEEVNLQKEFHSIDLAPAVICFDSNDTIGVIVMEPVNGVLKELMCEMDNVQGLVDSVVSIMEVMKHYKITHGDMHSGNIAYRHHPDGSIQLLLIDFGFASTRKYNPAVDAEQLLSELVEIEQSPFASDFHIGLQQFLNETEEAQGYELVGSRAAWERLSDANMQNFGRRRDPLVSKRKRQRSEADVEESQLVSAPMEDEPQESESNQDNQIIQVLQYASQEVDVETTHVLQRILDMLAHGIHDPVARGKMIGQLRGVVTYVPPLIGYPILAAAQVMDFALQREMMAQVNPIDFVHMTTQGIQELSATMDLTSMSQVFDTLTRSSVPCDFDDITVVSNMQRLNISVDQLMPMILKINEVVIQLTRPDVVYNQTIFEMANAFFVEVFAGLIPTLNELCQLLAQETPSTRTAQSLMNKLAEHNQTIDQIAGEHGGNWGLLGEIRASVDQIGFSPVNWLLRQAYRFLRQHVWSGLAMLMQQGHFVYQITFETAQMLLGMMSVDQTWLNRFYNFFDPTVGWFPRMFGRVGSQASIMSRGRMMYLNAFVSWLNGIITYFGVPSWMGYGIIFLTMEWSMPWIVRLLKYLGTSVVEQMLAPRLPVIESDIKWMCTPDQQCVPVSSAVCEERVGLVTRKKAKVPQYKCYASEANCKRLCE